MRNISSSLGQNKLMQLYQKNIQAGQVLITKNDLINRSSFLQIKNVIETMIQNNIIPIINENDTIKSRFNKFRDNDQVAIEIASKLQADLLIMLTNVSGVFTSDPDKENAKVIQELKQEDLKNVKLGKKTNKESTGGMHTKLEAALSASKIGIPVIIANGNEPGVLEKVVKGQKLGTSIKSEENVKSKQRWILLTKEQGTFEIDSGAFNALKKKNSLLAIGVKDVKGNFLSGDVVEIICNGKKIAKAITDLNSDVIGLIKGKKTQDIKKTLKTYNAVSKAENIVILK